MSAKAQKRRRANHRRLKDFPQELFENGFERQRPYSLTPSEVIPVPEIPQEMAEMPVRVSSDALNTSTQEPVNNAEEQAFDKQIDQYYYPEASPHFHGQQASSGDLYLSPQHGVRVGCTKSSTPATYPRNVAQFIPADNLQVVGCSTNWLYQESPVASYSSSTAMGTPPYSNHAGSGSFTSWSDSQTATPCLPLSTPRGMMETPVEDDFIGDPSNTSWSVPLDPSLDPLIIPEHWHGGYNYPGSGTWSNANPN